jgi:hypothetical protein
MLSHFQAFAHFVGAVTADMDYSFLQARHRFFAHPRYLQQACLPAFLSIVLFGMMPCLADWLGSAGSFYLKPPTGNLGTRTAIRTTVRPQLAHGRDSQSRPNLSYRRLEVLAKFRPLAARGSAQLLNLVQL